MIFVVLKTLVVFFLKTSGELKLELELELDPPESPELELDPLDPLDPLEPPSELKLLDVTGSAKCVFENKYGDAIPSKI